MYLAGDYRCASCRAINDDDFNLKKREYHIVLNVDAEERKVCKGRLERFCKECGKWSGASYFGTRHLHGSAIRDRDLEIGPTENTNSDIHFTD